MNAHLEQAAAKAARRQYLAEPERITAMGGLDDSSDTAPIATAIRELPLTIGRLTALIGFVVNYANDLSRIDRFSDDLIDAFMASERVRFVGEG